MPLSLCIAASIDFLCWVRCTTLRKRNSQNMEARQSEYAVFSTRAMEMGSTWGGMGHQKNAIKTLNIATRVPF
ncbi:Uncharacterized protein TCM_011670 [Theobroma cacao]|uniref:Secreted protein n=1 Tax=Theobroma cacao TaxID=3641 RepID=A0A061EB54_THECC|nr:Uncharacterized protein TCM_011670 [Theobroma cacao]